MELSRRHERELHRLGSGASGLWSKQRELLDEAGDLLKAAGKQAGAIAREDVYPRAKSQVEHLIEPVLRKLPRVQVTPPPKKSGAGAYVLMAVGAVALAGIAYAVWQTLRADEDLWVEEDDF